MVKFKKIAAVLFCLAIAAACPAMLIFPRPKKAGAAGEHYPCYWDDGSLSDENYLSAFPDVVGVAEDGAIELKRGIHVGKIPTTNAFLECERALRFGLLSDLLELDCGGLSRIERTALFREYGGAVYYSFDEFRYTGAGVSHENADRAEQVILLSGTLPASYLASMGATALVLRGEAEFSADRLLGSKIEKIVAAAPYLFQEGALYLEVAGQRRLVAALPTATALVLSDADYMDEGALLPCTALEELTLPYAGNAKRTAGEAYDGLFAGLFAADEGFFVPESLKKVKILGGKLISHCFYACPHIEEVNACGLNADEISEETFADMGGWKIIHAPKTGLILQGDYTSHRAPCGCTVYERI